MIGNVTIAFFAGLGVAIFIYSKTSYRGTGDFIKQVAPAGIAGILGFFIALTILWALFN
jgi:hypothetical protein